MRVAPRWKYAVAVLAMAALVRGIVSVPQPIISSVSAALEAESKFVDAPAPVALPIVAVSRHVAQVDSFSPIERRPPQRRPNDPLDSVDPERITNAPRFQATYPIPALPGMDSDATALEPPADAADVDPAPLRDELRGLLDEKLQLLTFAELRTEIERTERAIREIKARDRLEELRRDLERLGREYPQTWGGHAAQQLLHVPLPARAGESSDPFSTSPFGMPPVFAPTPSHLPTPRTVPQQRS